MASFDIVNKVNTQEIDNAVNNTRKEVESRYDFRGLHTEVTFHKNENRIHIVAAESMKMKAVQDMLVKNFAKRGLSSRVMDFGEAEGTTQGYLKMDIQLKEGIDRETAKKMVKEIKSLKIKVQPQIQEDQVRVSGKKIDDLQAVIAHLKSKNFGIPLQFVNMK